MESEMKIAAIGMMSMVATALLLVAGASRGREAFAQAGAGSIDAPSGGSPQEAPAAQSASIEGAPVSPPQAGTGLPRSEPPSHGPTGAAAPSVPSPSDGRAAYLQQLVTEARQQNEQLSEIHDQLAAQQQQAAEAESERQAEAEAESAQHAATLRALDTLRRAEAMLAIGSSDGVDDELANASTALWGRTRLDVDAAREALANEDLFLARQYLAAALAERRRPLN
jgi:hypothetical protein